MARRQQAGRAQARAIQWLLRSFNELQQHRGNTQSKLARALECALAGPAAPAGPDALVGGRRMSGARGFARAHHAHERRDRGQARTLARRKPVHRRRLTPHACRINSARLRC